MSTQLKDGSSNRLIFLPVGRRRFFGVIIKKIVKKLQVKQLIFFWLPIGKSRSKPELLFSPVFEEKVNPEEGGIDRRWERERKRGIEKERVRKCVWKREGVSERYRESFLFIQSFLAHSLWMQRRVFIDFVEALKDFRKKREKYFSR